MKVILLASHVSETPGGPFEKFYLFLKNRYTIYRIIHPISLSTQQKSKIDFKSKTKEFKIFPIFQYPLEGIYSLTNWLLHFKLPPQIDIAICFDSLSYFHLYMFKKIFRIKKIVYYNVDYSKKRFKNPVLNIIYKKITFFSFITCDYFFSFSNKFIDEVDPKGKYSSKHIPLKPLVDLSMMGKKRQRIKNSLLYIGSIDYATSDFGPLLSALKRLQKENISFRLDIYSKVHKESTLPKTVKKLGLEKNIFFKGTVDNETLTKKVLPRYMIGVAPYATLKSNKSPDHAFMNKDLTGRIVEYIAAGLPVVSTQLIEAFELIDKNEFGYSIVDPKDWYGGIKTLLTNPRTYKKLSKNALIFAKNYDARTILTPVFRGILGKH